jgi:hypothetical protein
LTKPKKIISPKINVNLINDLNTEQGQSFAFSLIYKSK